MLRRSKRGPAVPSAEPADLDEFGFPRAWVRDEPLHVGDVDPAWAVFEEWTARRGLQALPATITTVLLFLVDPPVRGSALRECWVAIDTRHSERYWHVDANPVFELERKWGVGVDDLGVVRVDPTLGKSDNDRGSV